MKGNTDSVLESLFEHAYKWISKNDQVIKASLHKLMLSVDTYAEL